MTTKTINRDDLVREVERARNVWDIELIKWETADLKLAAARVALERAEQEVEEAKWLAHQAARGWAVATNALAVFDDEDGVLRRAT